MKIENISGKTISWEWTEGAFKGGAYRNTFFKDGKVQWRGTAGAEEGQSAIEKAYEEKRIADNVIMVSWLEEISYTITVTLNFNDNTVSGFVSNSTEWYPHSGTITNVENTEE